MIYGFREESDIWEFEDAETLRIFPRIGKIVWDG